MVRPSAWGLLGALTVVALSPLPSLAEGIEEKAQVCASCHGEAGVPLEPTIPVIWGQHQGYLYIQLRDYKRGTRKDERMSPIAESLERADMMALAEYFSKKPWPSLNQPRADAATAASAERANAAVTCTACHLDQYQGDGTVARLAGQRAEYLAKTMMQFRTRERANNPGMSDLMIAISETEIAALTTYLAGR